MVLLCLVRDFSLERVWVIRGKEPLIMFNGIQLDPKYRVLFPSLSIYFVGIFYIWFINYHANTHHKWVSFWLQENWHDSRTRAHECWVSVSFFAPFFSIFHCHIWILFPHGYCDMSSVLLLHQATTHCSWEAWCNQLGWISFFLLIKNN